MRLLTLGGNGAVGAAVLRHAAAQGIEAHAVLRPGSNSARLDCDPVLCDPARVPRHHLCISDASALHTLFRRIKPDGLIMAAFPRGYASEASARRKQAVGMLDNLLALFTALEQLADRPRIVLLGSATVYGRGPDACDPRMAPRPQSFRGALKAAESVLARRLAQEHAVELVELRLLTGYGPFEQTERLIPQLLRAALGAREPITIARQPRWRDWVHYDDVARGCLQALVCKADTESTFDLCRGHRHTLQETAERLEQIVGRRLVAGFRDDIPDHYGDVGPCSAPDRNRFDWSAEIDLDSGLADCWKWARSAAGMRWLNAQGAGA